MGRQARLRLQRRLAVEDLRRRGEVILDEPLAIAPERIEPPSTIATGHLREVLYEIRAHTLLGGRACWELLVEALAHASGWQTDTQNDQVHGLWENIPMLDERLGRYAELWLGEVRQARERGWAFSDPLGDLLAEVDPAYQPTPMEKVRELNAEALEEATGGRLGLGGVRPTHVLFQHYGTGRYILDTLVYNPDLQVLAATPDPWSHRAMLVSTRLLAPYTTRRVPRQSQLAKLTASMSARLGHELFNPETGDTIDVNDELEGDDDPGDLLIIGGRVWAVVADPDIIDVNFLPNWLFGVQFWTITPSWERSMLIHPRFRFQGTWADYLAGGGDPNVPLAFEQSSRARGGVRYDFAMTDPG